MNIKRKGCSKEEKSAERKSDKEIQSAGKKKKKNIIKNVVGETVKRKGRK